MRNLTKTTALVALGLSVGLACHAGPSNEASSAASAPEIAKVNPSDQANASGQAGSADRNPCWKQAGLTKSILEERRSILSDAKAKIQNVESDSALTPPQQKQQIRRIRLAARQQVAKLMTPEQQQALRQCQQDHAASLPGGAGPSASPGSNPAPQDVPDAAQPK